MMFRPGVYSSPVSRSFRATKWPRSPYSHLPHHAMTWFLYVTLCRRVGVSPFLPAAPTPEASLGTTQFILPEPPDLLDVIPPWLIALGMDPVTKRNTRVSNRTISHYAGTQAHGHSQPEGLILLPVPGSRTGQASFDRIRLSGAPLSLDHAEVGLGGSHPGRWRGDLTDPCLRVPSEIVVIGKKRNS